ncbi:TPA: hypothetical protein U1C81_001795 [Streptococcus suis]|nr:hypothetical protein [Streptococcus suis]HEM3722020.1 hypothetical protein [Streptococcus suis]
MTYDELKMLVFEKLDEKEQQAVETYLDSKKTFFEKMTILEEFLSAFNYIDSALNKASHT